MINGKGIVWSAVYNTESEPAPAFALLRVIGTDSDGRLRVAKPSRNGQTDLLVNGSSPIPPNKYGQAHQEFPRVVAYDAAGEDNLPPSAGEIWGAEAGSWHLKKAMPGFVCLSDGENNGRVVVARQSTNLVLFVQVTSTTPDDGRYPAKERFYDPVDDAWSDGDECWYRDANGVVPSADSYHEAVHVGFANGRKVYQDTTHGGGAAGSLTVKESDGSPSYSSITVLEFDQDQGLVVSQPGSGRAEISIQDASGTQAGVVGLSDQTMGDGTKTFRKSVVVNYDQTTADGLLVYHSGTFTWLDDNSDLSANTFRVRPIAGTTQAHDYGVIDGYIQAVNTDAAVKYSQNGFQAQVFRLYNDELEEYGDVFTYVPNTSSSSIAYLIPGVASPTGAASDTGTYIGFDLSDSDRPQLRFTLSDSLTDGFIKANANAENYRCTTSIGAIWRDSGGSSDLPEAVFNVGMAAGVLSDRQAYASALAYPPTTGGNSITPPYDGYPAYGVNQKGFGGPGLIGTYWGWTNEGHPLNTAGQGLLETRAGLVTRPRGTYGDIEYIDDVDDGQAHLARLNIGNEDQVLTVVDVGGQLLPRWADLPGGYTGSYTWLDGDGVTPRGLTIDNGRITGVV